MRIALTGWTGSGKSTLFKALGGEPQPGQRGGTRSDSWPLVSVEVPDERLDWLSAHYKPKKHTPARIEFVDFPGLPREEEKGRGEMLHAIRETDALCLVVRGFASPAFEPADPDPVADTRDFQEEMIFSDFLALQNRLERLEQALRKPTANRERQLKEKALVERCLPELEEGRPIRSVAMTGDERAMFSGFAFLSEKPLIELINLTEEEASEADRREGNCCCAEIEAEIADLPPEDRAEFLADYGIEQPFRDRLIRIGYENLGLRSFFTVGEDECRAWTINEGDTALDAAGKIHTDLARGFIRAEVVSHADLKEAGGFREAKAAGAVQLVGKEYVVEDGDIINIRFSV